MKCLQYFSLKNAIKHERRFAFAVIPLLWIGLLAFPNLPIAVASEASAESPSSLELATSQTVSYSAASTLSPAAPFTMIIVSDPQFPWGPDPGILGYYTEFCNEQWHKVTAIENILKKEPESAGVRYWPKPANSGIEQNPRFDPLMYGKSVPDVKGVIINGDLTYADYVGHPEDWYMNGYWANPSHSKAWQYHRNSFYRSYYVDYLDDHCKGLPVYAGFGNHDNQWTLYDLACALTLPKEDSRRLWDNFPKPSTFYSIDFTLPTATASAHGSLSYSWDYNNYHFVQANNFNDIPKGPLDLGSKWLDEMILESPLLNQWLKWDLGNATQDGKRIVLNMHYWNGGIWTDLETVINGTNTVAVFVGHQIHDTGMYGWNSGRFERKGTSKTCNNAFNAFNQRIPVFQAGHSGQYPPPSWWDQDNQLLIVECGDNYMNVGLVRVGDWVDTSWKEGEPKWRSPSQDWTANERRMRTIKWVNTPPVVTDLQSTGTVCKGENTTVATGNFTDDACLWDSWTVDVDYGDGTPVEQLSRGPDWGQRYPLDLNHKYADNGAYNITVTVTDSGDEKGTATCKINVVPALSGFVIDEYHNKPLADVTITCDDKTTTTNAKTTTTNASGYYEITPLDPGDYWVNMTIPPGYNSIVPNKTATITANQETIVNFTAYPLPDIIFTKATADTERLAGDTITYHITVDNQGDGPATNIVITDVLPSMTTFISSNASATTNGQTLTWSIGTMNEHTSTTIELTVRISLLVYPDTILNNTVTVDFDDWYELPQTPETASATTVILPTVATENIQGVGYWQRQIKAVRANKPCDYTESELLLLLEKIRVSSQVFGNVYTLENAADLLATPTGKDTMETRATQQLLALWLNLAARAVAADTPLDLDDLTTATTIAEAITQCEAILLDPTHTKATCECSKEICDQLNNCHGLPW